MSELVPRALVVDDEVGIRDIVGFVLESNGYEVVSSSDASQARQELEKSSFDIAVVDVMLPGEDGVSFCRFATAAYGLPVILLTALGETPDRISGLEAGAADYLGKPFNPKELALRIKAVARRSDIASPAGRVVFEGLAIDVRTLSAQMGGTTIELSPPQFRLLLALAQRPAEVVPFSELLVHGWGSSEVLGGRELLKASMYRIRMKLAVADADGVRIQSARGVGYALLGAVEEG